MNQGERIKLIIKENNLKQKQFAETLEITESYVSKLIKDPSINISKQLLSSIEGKYGYNPDWITNGNEPKYSTISKSFGLSEKHKKLIAELERMPENDLLAVEAFVDSLGFLKNQLREATSDNQP